MPSEKCFSRESVEIVCTVQFPVHAKSAGIAFEVKPEAERKTVLLRDNEGAEDLDRIREEEAGVNDALPLLGFDDKGGIRVSVFGDIPEAVAVPRRKGAPVVFLAFSLGKIIPEDLRRKFSIP